MEQAFVHLLILNVIRDFLWIISKSLAFLLKNLTEFIPIIKQFQTQEIC